MRDPDCSTNKFRALAKELGVFLTYEATSQIKYEVEGISRGGEIISNYKFVVIPILRSGLPISEGALEIIPSALIGHFGFRRIYENRSDVERHLIALPTPDNAFYIIFDSVLGTGKTIDLAIQVLKDIGTEEVNIAICTLLSAQQGIDYVFDRHQDVNIYTASIESGLDKFGHIKPGFGSDENDKMYGIR